jgi:hypothetical protein
MKKFLSITMLTLALGMFAGCQQPVAPVTTTTPPSTDKVITTGTVTIAEPKETKVNGSITIAPAEEAKKSVDVGGSVTITPAPVETTKTDK